MATSSFLFLAFLRTALVVVLVLVVLLALPVLWAIGTYNSLVKLRNRYRNGFAQIDVQLKRRHELIPNLVETAKGYMNHERETLEAVIEARNMAQSALKGASVDDDGTMRELMTAEASLNAGLGKLFALSESYPELRSSENMQQLSEELTSTENKVAFARQAYNDAVTTYNTKVESFPASVIAGATNFSTAVLFEVADESEREAVEVKFD